ncbi:MAG: GGDEF domain-containing protein [Parvularculaceae bacterium]
MKVTGPRGPSSAAPAARAGAARGSAPPAPAEPIDAISFAGIPAEELTPRVRAALITLIDEVQQLRRDLAQTQSKMRELETEASRDPLLGILNRRAFVGELNRAIGMIERYGHPSSLVFVDVDNLKVTNDRHGHAAGDRALRHAADTITANIRQTDIFARLGGDEFAIILTNTGIDGAITKAAALTERVSAAPAPEGLAVSVTCGAVEISKGATVETALEAADRAMYALKARGR